MIRRALPVPARFAPIDSDSRQRPRAFLAQGIHTCAIKLGAAIEPSELAAKLRLVRIKADDCSVALDCHGVVHGRILNSTDR